MQRGRRNKRDRVWYTPVCRRSSVRCLGHLFTFLSKCNVVVPWHEDLFVGCRQWTCQVQQCSSNGSSSGSSRRIVSCVCSKIKKYLLSNRLRAASSSKRIGGGFSKSKGWKHLREQSTYGSRGSNHNSSKSSSGSNGNSSSMFEYLDNSQLAGRRCLGRRPKIIEGPLWAIDYQHLLQQQQRVVCPACVACHSQMTPTGADYVCARRASAYVCMVA